MIPTNTHYFSKKSVAHLAIFAVIIFVYMQMQRTIYRSGITVNNMFFHHLDSILNSFTLPLLFFIAGILFYNIQHNHSRSQLFHKALNVILYPYILWTLIQGFLQTQLTFLTDSSLTMLHVINNLLDEPLGHLGYLYAVFYMVIIGIQLLYKPSQKRLALLFAISAALHLSQHQLNTLFPLYLIAPYFVFFVAGIAIQPLTTQLTLKTTVHIGLLSLGIFIAAQGLFHGYYQQESYAITLSSFLLRLCSVIALFFIAKLFDNTKTTSTSLLLGKAAFFIFLSHVLLGSGMRVILQNIFSINSLSTHLLLDCGSAIIGGFILYWLLEHSKISLLWQAPTAISSDNITKNAATLFKRYPLSKYITISLGCLSIAALLAIYILSEIKIKQQFSLPTEKTILRLSNDPAVIENGKRLAQIYGCYLGCHGKNMEGGVVKDTPFKEKLIAPNLTQAFATYSIDELELIVRHGLKPDGSAVMGSMPISGYHYMSDDQLSAIFSFIAQSPQETTTSKPSTFGWLSRVNIITGQYKTHFEEIQTLTFDREPPSTGERLAKAACSECHGVTLNGGKNAPSLLVAKAYTFDDFQRLQKTGVGLGNRNLGLMSIMARHRFSNFTDSELRAIYQFLTTER
jgi:mono/diheme cytochrome c family protein